MKSPARERLAVSYYQTAKRRAASLAAADAPRRREQSPVREQSGARNYRWRIGAGRESYLESKARENAQPAMKAGRVYRPRCKSSSGLA